MDYELSNVLSPLSSEFNPPLLLSLFIFQFAILILGAAYVLCGKYGKRETEAHVEADAELGYLSNGYEDFGGYGRSRRSPIKPGVGWQRACTGIRKLIFVLT